MSTYTRAEVDAEIHKVLASTQKMLEDLVKKDMKVLAARREDGCLGRHSYWIDGRVAAYTLAAEHLGQLKEGYQ